MKAYACIQGITPQTDCILFNITILLIGGGNFTLTASIQGESAEEMNANIVAAVVQNIQDVSGNTLLPEDIILIGGATPTVIVGKIEALETEVAATKDALVELQPAERKPNI